MKSCNWVTRIGLLAQQICCWWVLCSLAAAALLPLPGVSAAPVAEMRRQLAAPLTVERSSATEVVLVWQAPTMTLAPVTVAGVRYTAPHMVGLSTLAAPGEPQLPSATLLLAVPPGATPIVTFLSGMTTTVLLLAPLLPAPVASQPVDPREPLPQPAQLALPAAPKHHESGLFPAAVATVSLPQQWRSQQVVRVRINPVQVDDARRQMVVYQALRVAVRFVGGEQGIGALTGALNADKVPFDEGPFNEGPFEPLLAAVIAN